MWIISTNLSKVTTYTIKTFKIVSWKIAHARCITANPATDIDTVEYENPSYS